MSNDITKKLQKIVSDYKGESVEMPENSTFDELGFDSLDKVDLVMKIEEEFDISFGDDINISTVGELIQKIQALIK